MLAAQAATFQKLRAQYERDPPFFKRMRQMTLLEQIYNNVQDKITMPPKHERVALESEPRTPSALHQ